MISGLNTMLKQVMISASRMRNKISIRRSCKGGEHLCTFEQQSFALMRFVTLPFCALSFCREV